MLRYLGHRQSAGGDLSGQIEKRQNIMEKAVRFKYVSGIFALDGPPYKIAGTGIELGSKDADFYLEGCTECRVSAYTLGFEAERVIKYYQHLDLSFALVLDRTANRMLEELRDNADRSRLPKERTFRFAPGYGDIPVSLLSPLSGLIGAGKAIGLSVNPNGLMSPAKSILGIIGIGAVKNRTCGSCIRKDYCLLRKGGERCYAID